MFSGMFGALETMRTGVPLKERFIGIRCKGNRFEFGTFWMYSIYTINSSKIQCFFTNFSLKARMPLDALLLEAFASLLR